MTWRAVWNSVTTESGELCVMTSGEFLMPELCAGNWDTVMLVSEVAR